MAGVITGRRLNVEGLRLSLDDRAIMQTRTGKTINTSGYVDPATVLAGKGRKKARAIADEGRRRREIAMRREQDRLDKIERLKNKPSRHERRMAAQAVAMQDDETKQDDITPATGEKESTTMQTFQMVRHNSRGATPTDHFVEAGSANEAIKQFCPSISAQGRRPRQGFGRTAKGKLYEAVPV